MKTIQSNIINSINLIPLGLVSLSLLSGAILVSSTVSAEDPSVVDEINITVPVSCTISGTGMNTHNANINNGLYEDDIGSTVLHAFCNDNEGFAIYAAGYTGNEVGGTNSNKLVGTTASSNATIESGIATTAGNPDVSNWAMKLTMTQDSGDTTTDNAFTIDSAPNVALPSTAESGATQAPFSAYHVVPNEYVKVAHKNSGTDMTAGTGGVKLTTTYAAYISKTQPADTYSGQVIYVLVHPADAMAPVSAGKIGVQYDANGSTFSGGATKNEVIYQENCDTMYQGTTPTIAKTSNVGEDGTNIGDGAPDSENGTNEVTLAGASKLKVELKYGTENNYDYLYVFQGEYTGEVSGGMEAGQIATYNGGGSDSLSESATLYVDGDTVTFAFYNDDTGGSAGYYAKVYPLYATEQSETTATSICGTVTVDTGTYATTTDWYGSWYADINNTHYDFLDETEVENFLTDNIATLGGTTVDLYRGLTFDEAYARANKTQDSGYYKQQELTKSMCNTIAITQNETLKDVRDNNTYMVGKLKDGNCWMLDNLALDPTDPTTAANMNASNTNASTAAINNLLNGGSSTTGWSNVVVADVDANFNSYTEPRINNASKDTLVTSYGPASTNGQAKVGIYYNYCAASASTYCYAGGQGIDVPDTIIDAPQDICPANWRMPTGGNTGEYLKLAQKYSSDATNTNSLQYNLSTPLSGYYYYNAAINQGSNGGWWSSSFDDEYYMHDLVVLPDGAGISKGYGRDDGQSMRCLMAD